MYSVKLNRGKIAVFFPRNVRNVDVEKAPKTAPNPQLTLAMLDVEISPKEEAILLKDIVTIDFVIWSPVPINCKTIVLKNG